MNGLLEVADPREIQRLAEDRTTPDQVLKSWVVSPDPQAHVEALMGIAKQGFTHVFVHSAQENQRRFIDFYGSHVLPGVRAALREEQEAYISTAD